MCRWICGTLVAYITSCLEQSIFSWLLSIQRRALCWGVDRDYTNQLLIDEFLNAKAGKLPPVAGVLYTAERQFRCGPGRVVDEDHSRFDATGNVFASFYLRRKYGAAETVF